MQEQALARTAPDTDTTLAKTPEQEHLRRTALVDNLLGTQKSRTLVVRAGPRAFGIFAAKADVTIFENADGFIQIDWKKRTLLPRGNAEKYRVIFDRAASHLEIQATKSRGFALRPISCQRSEGFTFSTVTQAGQIGPALEKIRGGEVYKRIERVFNSLALPVEE